MTTGKRQIPIDNQAANLEADGAGTAAGRATGTSEARGAAQAAGRGEHPRGARPEDVKALTSECDALAAERDALAIERDALNDSLLRLRAEFDNFRKRASRELIEARDRAQADLLHDFLPVLDNLERALDAAEHHEEGKVLDGVRMVRDMFVALLGRVGVAEVEGVGTAFDPRVHEAMLVQPSEHDEGVVAVVLERGYRQGDRVLRPARVVVSAGPGGDSGVRDAGGPAGGGRSDETSPSGQPASK